MTMTEYFQLAIGVAGLSLISFYVCWTKFRVFCLRQELFDVRNELWDSARALECFDDPVYMEARESLNSLIRSAHKISLPVLVHVMVNYPQTERSPAKSTNAEMQKSIDYAIAQSVACLTRYVFYYRPFSGWLWALTIRSLYKTMNSIAAIRDGISKWFRGGGPGQLEALACP